MADDTHPNILCACKQCRDLKGGTIRVPIKIERHGSDISEPLSPLIKEDLFPLRPQMPYREYHLNLYKEGEKVFYKYK
jgi:hypothetical protein